MKEIGRLLTAMVTPFDEQGWVAYEWAKVLALSLLNSGSDGVVIVGTTGESPTLTQKEELRLFAEIKSVINKQGAVIAGTGSNCTRTAIETTKEAEQIGVDGCLLVVPYYNRPNQEGLYQHFKTIAENTNLPCILYNVPSRTVTNLSAETVVRLSQIDNIIGIKEASGDFGQIAQIITGAPSDFLVWSGNDSDTFLTLALGGYGVVSVASHLVGSQIKKMIEAFVKGDIEKARIIHLFLLPFFKALFLDPNPIPIKYALNHIGFPVGKPRLPLTEPNEQTAAQIIEVLSRYHIDVPL